MDVARTSNDVIIVTDKIHTSICARAAERTADAANISKPPLSRSKYYSVSMQQHWTKTENIWSVWVKKINIHKQQQK